MKVRYKKYSCVKCNHSLSSFEQEKVNKQNQACPYCHEATTATSEMGDSDCWATGFNMSSLNEVLVNCDDGGDSAYTRDLYVLIEHSPTGLCSNCGHFWAYHTVTTKCTYSLGPPFGKSSKTCGCGEVYEPTWKLLDEAFKNKDVITDNFNTYFFEPATPEDRIRGYAL